MTQRERVVIFSGAHSAGELGATRAVDLGLVNAFARAGCSVSWLARGADAPPPIISVDLDSLPMPGVRSIMNTVCSLVTRALFRTRYRQRALLSLYSQYDKRAASVIPQVLHPSGATPIVIGRSGLSGRTFAAARTTQAHVILRSQWLHPVEHASLLGDELERIGLQSARIPRSRLRRQREDMDQADLIWCNSTLVLDSHRNQGVPEERLLYTPLGVDLNRYAVDEADLEALYPPRKADFRVLFVGSVNPEKGVHLLLEALLLSRVTGCEVVLNGVVAPYFKGRLDDLIARLARKNVCVTVQPGDPRPNYRRASVLVLPSVHDSFGLVVLEAMAAGLPVILSTNVGAKDCMRDGRDGLHFRALDVQHLAACIESLHSDRGRLETLGRSARRAVEDYTWDAVAGRFLTALHQRGFLNSPGTLDRREIT